MRVLTVFGTASSIPSDGPVLTISWKSCGAQGGSHTTAMRNRTRKSCSGPMCAVQMTVVLLGDTAIKAGKAGSRKVVSVLLRSPYHAVLRQCDVTVVQSAATDMCSTKRMRFPHWTLASRQPKRTVDPRVQRST